jgi:hypothetical protein
VAVSPRDVAQPQRAVISAGWILAGPKEWGSWRGIAPVVPCRTGVRQGLRGRGLRGRDPCGAWIWHRAGVWHDQKGRDVSRVWIQRGAGAQHNLKGGRSRWSRAVALQPMEWELGKPALLLLDLGVEKVPTI